MGPPPPNSLTGSFALLGHTSMQAIFAWQAGQPITVAQFLADAEFLASQLTPSTHLVNRCADAYRFTVGLVAAMLRGQVSILPHNHAPQTLRDLANDYPDLQVLVDQNDDTPELPWLRCPSGHAPIGAQTIPSFAADHLVAILFTSGSTGRPQALPRRWGSIALSAKAEAQCLRLTPEQPCAIMATVPAQHSYGFESAIWLPMLAGGQIVAERPLYPADVFARLGSLPMPRILVTSPVHLRAMLGSSLPPPPASIVMSATAPLPVDLAQAAERHFDASLIEIYGSTETGQVASRRTAHGDVWQTLPGVRFVQNGDTTLACDGHVGIATALSDDIDLIDAQHFRLLGRHADLINIGGKRGSLRGIEQQLLAISGVEDAAVLTDDSRHLATARLTAFVVAPTLTAAQILQTLRQQLDAVFLPRPLIFVDRLPRDGTGKLPRERLIDLAQQSRPS